MVLVDTSVWIDHFRQGHPELKELLNNAQVVCHPFVVGELACGGLKKRAEILSLLQSLPMARLAEHSEVLRLIESRKLMNLGLGYIDIHLLASTILTGVPIWTLDKKLDHAADELGVSFKI
jgi:predicted nucleic acid-binding protein